MCRYRWNPNGNHLCLSAGSYLDEWAWAQERTISYRLSAAGNAAWWLTIRTIFIFFVLLTKRSEARPARSRAVTPREAQPRPALPAAGTAPRGAAAGRGRCATGRWRAAVPGMSAVDARSSCRDPMAAPQGPLPPGEDRRGEPGGRGGGGGGSQPVRVSDGRCSGAVRGALLGPGEPRVSGAGLGSTAPATALLFFSKRVVLVTASPSRPPPHTHTRSW